MSDRVVVAAFTLGFLAATACMIAWRVGRSATEAAERARLAPRTTPIVPLDFDEPTAARRR